MAFSGPDCPLSKLYRPKLDRLSKEYSRKEVRLLVVSTDDDVFVPLLEPARTTEAFVLDKDGVLRYRGAIDDQYGVGYHRDAATRSYLTDAIDALLAGKQPPVAATEAPGCQVERPHASPAPTKVTFHKDVEPIFQKRCVDCHRPGEIGPFSLLTYAKAKANSQQIKAVVSDRRMPPWHADPKTGEWKNDRHLSDAEIATISSWVAAGAPEGDSRDAPPPRKFVEGWQIGTPDVVYKIPTPQEIPAEGTIPYAYIEVRTDLKEDKWVQAMEVRPGARAVVHHVLVFVRYPAKRRGEETPIDGGLLNGYFGIMVPGESAMVFPEGMGKKLPADARLVFQIHYTATGKAAEDQTSIGLVFAKKPVKHEVTTRGIVNLLIRIPPGAADHEETASYTFDHDAKILSLLPHTHVRGKAFKYVAFHPDGKEEVLLDVPEYDFNWQTCYRYKEPLSVKKGTRIKVFARYDNSKNNPANPDPTKEVRFGKQTWQEMLIGYVDFVRD
ncbi:peroxiredoxin [bacterium]|nr:peroxiredoxin [bacterium]